MQPNLLLIFLSFWFKYKHSGIVLKSKLRNEEYLDSNFGSRTCNIVTLSEFIKSQCVISLDQAPGSLVLRMCGHVKITLRRLNSDDLLLPLKSAERDLKLELKCAG